MSQSFVGRNPLMHFTEGKVYHGRVSGYDPRHGGYVNFRDDKDFPVNHYFNRLVVGENNVTFNNTPLSSGDEVTFSIEHVYQGECRIVHLRPIEKAQERPPSGIISECGTLERFSRSGGRGRG